MFSAAPAVRAGRTCSVIAKTNRSLASSTQTFRAATPQRFDELGQGVKLRESLGAQHHMPRRNLGRLKHRPRNDRAQDRRFEITPAALADGPAFDRVGSPVLA